MTKCWFCLTNKMCCIIGMCLYLILTGLKILVLVVTTTRWLAVGYFKVAAIICCAALITVAVILEERVSCITMITINGLILVMEVFAFVALLVTEGPNMSVPLWVEIIASFEHTVYVSVMVSVCNLYKELSHNAYQIYQQASDHNVQTHRTHRIIGV